MANQDPKPSPEARGKTCGLMFDQMTIDCRGDIYLCCAMPNHPSLKIGRYLEMTADEILFRRFTHQYCPSCPIPAEMQLRWTRHGYIAPCRRLYMMIFYPICRRLRLIMNTMMRYWQQTSLKLKSWTITLK